MYLSYLLAKSHKRNVDTYFPVSPLSISSNPLTLADVLRNTLSNGDRRRFRIGGKAIYAQSSMGRCQVSASCPQCSQPDAEEQAILRCDAPRKYFSFSSTSYLLNDGAKRNRLLYLKIMYTNLIKVLSLPKFFAFFGAKIGGLFLTYYS